MMSFHFITFFFFFFISDCEAGRYGAGCLQTCHCASGQCDRFTGQCLGSPPGCSGGWSGVNCQSKSIAPGEDFYEIIIFITWVSLLVLTGNCQCMHTYTCMYLCMYVCMYVRTCTSSCEPPCACLCTSAWAWVHNVRVCVVTDMAIAWDWININSYWT